MAKRRRKKKGKAKHKRNTSVIGRVLSDLRRSSAAGTHGPKRKDRYNSKRKAIDEGKQ